MKIAQTDKKSDDSFAFSTSSFNPDMDRRDFIKCIVVTSLFGSIGCNSDAKDPVESGTSNTQLKLKTDTFELKIGNTVVKLDVVKKTDNPVDIPCYICLHENETTAVNVAKRVINDFNGKLLVLRGQGKGVITFELNGKLYSFDPQKMFSDKGWMDMLQEGNVGSDLSELKQAGQWIGALSDSIFQNIFMSDNKIIIAVQNTQVGENCAKSCKSVLDYKGLFGLDRVVVNADVDPHNYLYVTSSGLFHKLQADGAFNAVLHDAIKVMNDGSLAATCSSYGDPRKYIGVNVKIDKPNIQYAMLKYLQKLMFL